MPLPDHLEALGRLGQAISGSVLPVVLLTSPTGLCCVCTHLWWGAHAQAWCVSGGGASNCGSWGLVGSQQEVGEDRVELLHVSMLRDVAGRRPEHWGGYLC